MKNLQNFTKCSFNVVNNSVQAIDNKTEQKVKLFPHSLVLLQVSKSGKKTLYNLVSKIRNTDKISVLKALIKVCIANDKAFKTESEKAVYTESGFKPQNLLKQVLSSFAVFVTDKNGVILPNSGYSVLTESNVLTNFRECLKLRKGVRCYDRYLNNNIDFSDLEFNKLLNSYLLAVLENVAYINNIDNIILQIAKENEKAEKAEQKAIEKAKAEFAKAQQAKAEAEAKKAELKAKQAKQAQQAQQAKDKISAVIA